MNKEIPLSKFVERFKNIKQDGILIGINDELREDVVQAFEKIGFRAKFLGKDGKHDVYKLIFKNE